MVRPRLASLVAVLWSAVQAWSLLGIGLDPAHHLIAWGLCAVFLILAAGLWLAQPLARISAIALGAGFLVFYVVVASRAGNLCSGTLCVLVLSQPVLTIAMLAVLLKPFHTAVAMASNNALQSDVARPAGGRRA